MDEPTRTKLTEEIWECRTFVRALCYRSVWRETDAAGLAEDLTQEIMVKAWRGLDKFKQNAKISSWMHRIAINHCLTYHRTHRRRSVSTDDVLYAIEDSTDHVLELLNTGDSESRYISDLNALRQARRYSQYLDPSEKKLFHSLLVDKTWVESARMLGLKLSAYKSRVRRLRKRLQELNATNPRLM